MMSDSVLIVVCAACVWLTGCGGESAESPEVSGFAKGGTAGADGCECAYSDCCDGCHYLSEQTQCSYDLVTDCTNQTLGNCPEGVWATRTIQQRMYCSGEGSECDGRISGVASFECCPDSEPECCR